MGSAHRPTTVDIEAVWTAVSTARLLDVREVCLNGAAPAIAKQDDHEEEMEEVPGGAGQCVHQSMRKAVFVAECKATSCMGRTAESVLDFDSQPRKVGEWRQTGTGERAQVYPKVRADPAIRSRTW